MRFPLRQSPVVFRAITQLLIAAMLLSGCAAKHAGTREQQAGVRFREVLVREVEYSPKGLPIFSNRLERRPSRGGDRFTLVRFINDRPATSFDIAVLGPNADFTRPFKAIYEWTGKGFQAGALGSAATLDLASHAGGQVHDRNDAVIVLAVILTPMAVGAAGGFLIGLADGIKTTVEEMGKVVLGNYEQVATYTTYTYDAHDRLYLMRMFRADDSLQELVRTDYTYEADSPVPVTTVITTYPDGTIKTLQ